jgi:MFS family permease
VEERTPDRATATALIVLALTFSLALLGRGFAESFTVFLLPVSGQFGWERGTVLSIYSLAALTSGLASPVVGRLFDRFGPRIVFGGGLLLLAAAYLGAAHAHRLWQFQACLGLGAGFGVACIGNVPAALLLGRWFARRLTAAMAVVYSAAGAGVLLLLPASQLLIDTVGWRGAYQVFAGVALALLLALLLLPWRRWSAGAPHHRARPQASGTGLGFTLRAALRHHAFWALFATFFFTAVGMYAVAAQVVAYLVDAGFPPLQAATAWGFSGVALLVGMLGISWLDGLIGRRPSVLFAYALSLGGVGMLALLPAWPHPALLTGFVICFGATIGSRGPLITATAMAIFRGDRVGTIYGSISIGSGLGAALGSWSGGLIHDATGGYGALLVYAAVNIVLGALPFLTVPALRAPA